MTRAERVLLLAVVFFTNVLSLACQVIWVRKLSLLFGSTAAVFSIVVSIFLLGLALGALGAGRIAERDVRPWRHLAWLEILLGVYCLVSLWVFAAGRAFFVAVFPTDLGPLSAALSKAAVVLVSMLPPTLAIGAIFPLAVRTYARRREELGGDVSLVYGIDTIGAASGALLAAFIFVPSLGLAVSTALLGVAALLLGGGLWVWGRAWPVPASLATAARARKGNPHPVPETPPSGLVLGMFFLTGGAALLLETGWNRFFYLLNGTHVYSTGSVLAGFLGGIGIGSLAMGRRLDRIRNPCATVAHLYALTALGGVLVFRTQDLFARIYFALFAWSPGYYAFQLSIAAVVLVIVSLATLAMGANFPLVARIAASGGSGAGASAGRVFFVNTLGAVVGALLGEFVFLPRFGFDGLLTATLVLYTLGAVVFLALASRTGRSWHASGVAAVLAAALAISPLTHRLALPSHALYYHGLRNRTFADYQSTLGRMHVVFEKDGFYGRVTVCDLDGFRLLRINGKTDASTRPEDYATQLLLGHLPLLLDPGARHALVIGLGGGGTLRAVVHHSDLERITMVEIDPLVVEAAHDYFAEHNDHALDDPRVRVVTNDGRNYVDGTTQRFDVIVSEPSNLWVAGVSGLFTREFYHAARAHLNPGGILSQWMPLYELRADDFRMILRTIGAEFARVAYYQVGTDLIVLASDRAWSTDAATLDHAYGFAGVASDLNQVGLSREALPGALARAGTPPAGTSDTGLNVDDRPLLEFSTARFLYDALKQAP